MAHEAAQVMGRRGDEITFAELVDADQPGAPRAAGLADVGEGPLDAFAAQSLQAFATLAASPPAVGIDRRLLLRRLVGPGAVVPERRLGDVHAAGRVLRQ